MPWIIQDPNLTEIYQIYIKLSMMIRLLILFVIMWVGGAESLRYIPGENCQILTMERRREIFSLRSTKNSICFDLLQSSTVHFSVPSHYSLSLFARDVKFQNLSNFSSIM